jgi:phage I-like protein
VTTEKTAVCNAQPLPAEGAVPDRIHLLPFGKFTGRDGRGPWLVGDKDDAARIIANTQSYQGKADIPIDYEHASIIAAPKGQQAPAAGWITSLEVGPNGIWGNVQWTAAAAQKIKDREYRYLSPVMRYNDGSGLILRIISAGLVNTPNRELTALNSQGATMPPDTIAAAKALLGLDGADDSAFLKAIGDLSTLASAFCRVLKLPPDTPAAGLLDALMQMSNADQVEACSAVVGKGGAQLATGRADIPPDYVAMSALNALSEHANRLQDQLNTVAVEKAVQTALARGAISPAMTKWATALCSSDPKAFEDFMTKIPAAFGHIHTSPFEGKTKNPPTSGHGGGLSDDHLAICRQMNISPDAFAKNLSE